MDLTSTLLPVSIRQLSHKAYYCEKHIAFSKVRSQKEEKKTKKVSTVHGDTAITCPFNVLDRTGRGLRVYMHVFTEVLFFVGLVVVE